MSAKAYSEQELPMLHSKGNLLGTYDGSALLRECRRGQGDSPVPAQELAGMGGGVEWQGERPGGPGGPGGGA